MSHTAGGLRPKKSRLRRAFETLAAWLQALEYSASDHTLDRIERLEREVTRLNEEIRQLRAVPANDARDDLALDADN